MKHLLCLGLGYVAKHLINYLDSNNWLFTATSRNPKKYSMHDKVRIIDLTELSNIEDVTHILVSIPPSVEGDIILNNYHDELARFSNLHWIGYLSTTGVYGNHHGNWVTEETITAPNSQRLFNRVLAEQQWLNFVRPSSIFRLAGIYGEGYSIIDKIKNNSARIIRKKGQVFSRIHVDDIVHILCADMQKPNNNEIYNCADDLPVESEQVTRYACRLMNYPLPPIVELTDSDISEMTRSFYKNNKRVDNSKIKLELGINLLYSNYIYGLASIVYSHGK